MATIENRLENVENKVESIETLLNSVFRHEDHVMNLHAQLVEMLKDQKQHLLKHDEQIANQQVHLQKLDRLFERQQQQMEHQQRQLEKQDERLDSMQRFNLQTRRMWVSMARQMDWDYEDPDLDS